MKTDLRTIKTKASIKNAFKDLMVDTTFDKITVQAICDKALINRVTFYNHYSDKYDLFNDYLDETLMNVFNESVNEYNIKSQPDLFFKSLFQNIARLCFTNKNILKTIEFQENSIIAFIIQNTAYDKLKRLLEMNFSPNELKYPASTISAFLMGGFTNIISYYVNNKNSNFDALIKESSSIIDDLLNAIIIK